MLSIIIPVYNENSRIVRINKLYQYCKKNFKNFEIIIVDDGSTDNTKIQAKKIIKELSAKNITIIGYKRNKGKGYAIKTGFKKAIGDKIFFMDVDLSTSLKEISKFLKLSDKYDIVIGSRALPESKVISRSHKKAFGRIGNLLVRVVLCLDYKDTQCGFKLFNKSSAKIIFPKLKVNRWGFDIETLYLAKKLGLNVKEQAVTWKEDEESKVRWYDYFTTLKDLIRIRLGLN